MASTFDKIAKCFAKDEGFDGADFIGQFEGQEVFCATSKHPMKIGLPPYFLVSADSARWPSSEEEETLFQKF